MLTLGIETSCDETSCAVLKGRDEILSNIVSSSLFRHQPFGGVVPEIASRHCLEQIDFVFQEALQGAGCESSDLDLIAVTEGPGLIGSLLVGVSFAKSLSLQLQKPLIGVNHLEAHLAANFIGQDEPEKYAGLLVSGGHTSLSYHEKGKVLLLGATADDAVGEAYDKVAKILGLGYPGGPILDRLAQKGNPKAFRFTRPKQKNRFDFSFSGVKTAVLYEAQKRLYGTRRGRPGTSTPHSKGAWPLLFEKVPGLFGDDEKFVEDIAASFQRAVVTWLVEKTLDAARFKKVTDIVVGGGVSANSQLRRRLEEEGLLRGLRIWFPPFSLTVDNAAMIARRGLELYEKGKRDSLKLAPSTSLKMGENPVSLRR